MKKGRVNAKYDPQYTKSQRTFPTTSIVLLAIILAVQIGLVIFGFAYQPKPQDVIHQYDVTVTPRTDGSLDIEYHIVWEALDPNEPLTWVEIGMANQNYTVYADSVSDNVLYYSKYSSDGYVSLKLGFGRAYRAGDVLELSFKINQKDMLCKNEQGYFYEFVPGWFNAIQVENYCFRWCKPRGDLIWEGALDYGEYCIMTAQYGPGDFSGCQVINYRAFKGSGAYNELRQDVAIPCCFFAALLIIAEVYIIDCYVSYVRGRGFLTGHGYHVHTYGRSNPHYVRARNRYNATHSGRSGGGRSGGCACACACACAGGGRAGCSQKDTYTTDQKPASESFAS